jgi:mannosyltransferase
MNVVYDDIIYSLQKCGGGSVYWSEITTCDTFFPSFRIVYDSAIKNHVYNKSLLKDSIVKSSRLLLIKRFISLKINKWKDEPFLFHSSYYRYSRNKNAYNITTIHDFTNEIYGRGILAYIRKIRKRKAVAHSKGVICISKNTLNDFKKFYPNYQGLLKVVYNGYDDQSYYMVKGVSKENIILFVGARTDYKRFDLAVKIVCKFTKFQLVIIGGGNLCDSEVELLEKNLKNRYKKYDYVNNDMLRVLYNQAFFLCYPSEYEGFGIPIIEAQACGCPVVCQKKSCIPEIGGNAVVYFSENEIEDETCEIYKLSNPDYYTKKVEEGLLNVKNFSWSKSRYETKNFYKDVINEK